MSALSACQTFDRWIAVRSAGVLSDHELAELDRHLGTCDDCRDLATLIAPAGTSGPSELDVLDDLVAVDTRHYVVTEQLAQGGMGRTFLAWDRRLGRTVVLKEPLASGDAATRVALELAFQREARLTARLQHPAIVSIYEAGRHASGDRAGRPFYAMPLVRGTPLDVEIGRREALEDRLALLPALTTVANAIAYAHEQGVVHRDLKPTNVLIGGFGEAVIIDWGLGKDVREAEALRPLGGATPFTVAGFGTAPYMAPEQVLGGEADARVDVYALGATLYHLLARHPPYHGVAPAEVRARVLAGPPAPLAEVAGKVPAALRAIVGKAMARRASDRFASGRELADELSRFQANQLVRSHRHTLAERLQLGLRRHRGAAWVGVIALVALTLTGAASVAKVVRERERATLARREAVAALARNLEDQGLRELEDHDLSRATLLLAEAYLRQPDSRSARFAVARAREALAHRPLVLASHNRGNFDARFDARGERVITAGLDRAARVWDGRTGAELVRLDEDAAVHSALFLPGDTHVLLGRDDGLLVIREARQGGTRRELARLDDGVIALDLDPSGRLVAVAGADGMVRVFELARGRELLRVDACDNGDPLCEANAVDFSPDGASLVTASDSHMAMIWDRSGRRMARLAGHNSIVLAAAFDTAGTRVVTAGADDALVIWDARTGEELRRLASASMLGNERAYALAFSADGTRFASAHGNSVRLWDAGSLRLLATLRGHTGRVNSMVFAPDGTRLVTSSYDGTARIFSLGQDALAIEDATLAEMERLPGPALPVLLEGRSPDSTNPLSASGDGWLFAGGDRRGVVTLWEASSGRRLLSIAAHHGAVSRIGFSDGDTRLVTVGDDGTRRTWPLTLESAAPAGVLAEVEARVPYRLVRGRLERVAP